MRPFAEHYDDLVQALHRSKTDLEERVRELEQFEEAVVQRELRMMTLERELHRLKTQFEPVKRHDKPA